MKIGIISGSHRQDSQSARVAKYVEKTILSLPNEGGTQVYFLNLADNPLPLWDEGIFEAEQKWQTVWQPISKELQSCEGYVVVTPEWSGMVPSGLKNLFLLCGNGELAHKAALITAVSSSRGGSYPVNELRTSSYKNTRICYMPEHVIVRDCEKMLHDGAPANEDDQYLRGRIAYTCKLFLAYTRALNSVRAAGIIDRKTYPNGM